MSIVKYYMRILLTLILLVLVNSLYAQVHNTLNSKGQPTSRCRLSKAMVISDSDPDCTACKAEDKMAADERSRKEQETKDIIARQRAQKQQEEDERQKQQAAKNKEPIAAQNNANQQQNNANRSFWDDEQPTGSGNNAKTGTEQSRNQQNNNNNNTQDVIYKQHLAAAESAAANNNYAEAAKAYRQADKIKADPMARKNAEALDILERSQRTGSVIDNDKLLKDQAMDDFDGTTEGSIKTLAKGVGTMAATGKLNAGIIAGGAGLLLSGPSPEEKARREREAAAERDRQEQLRQKRELEERKKRMLTEYFSSLKKEPCVNSISGSGVNTVYTYYIIAAPDAIIFTDLISINKYEDGGWPYCSDIEKKLIIELRKIYNAKTDSLKPYIQKPFKDKVDAAKDLADALNKADRHYCNRTVLKFKAFEQAPIQEGKTSTGSEENNEDFWNK